MALKIICRHCGENPGSLICTGCRDVSYCSNECQLASWKQGHKELCRGRTNTRHLTPIPPLNPPPARMSPPEERAARTDTPWGLETNCTMALDSRYLDSYDYYAFPSPPVLEVVAEDFHRSEKIACIDFPHATNEILCEITVITGGPPPTRYRAVVRTPPDFHAANERSCDIGPPYRVSEELCNRTAVGIQQSFAKQIFALPDMRRCTNRACQTALSGIESTGPRTVVIASRKLVHRNRKTALGDIWAPTCRDETCIATIRTALINSFLKN
ncbi:hypothetical protein C8R46DRAFT_1108659, partial [Mycena filopes]